MASRTEKAGGKLSETKSELRPGDLGHIVQLSGWGRITLNGELEHGSHISVIVTGCAFCGKMITLSITVHS